MTEGQTDGRKDGRTEGREYGRKRGRKNRENEGRGGERRKTKEGRREANHWRMTEG